MSHETDIASLDIYEKIQRDIKVNRKTLGL